MYHITEINNHPKREDRNQSIHCVDHHIHKYGNLQEEQQQRNVLIMDFPSISAPSQNQQIYTTLQCFQKSIQ